MTNLDDEPHEVSKDRAPFGREIGDEKLDELPLDDIDEPADNTLLVPRYVPLSFVSIVVALPSTSPVVILRDERRERELRIPIGLNEGVAMAYAARHIATPKPLTHGLFTSVLEAFSLNLSVVRITDVLESSFFAEIVLSGPSGTRSIACRPSDGISLALSQALPVPITAADSVMALAGIDVSSAST